MILPGAFWLQFQKILFHKPFQSRSEHELIVTTQNACIRVCCTYYFSLSSYKTKYIVCQEKNNTIYCVSVVTSGWVFGSVDEIRLYRIFESGFIFFSRQPYPLPQCRPGSLFSGAWSLKLAGYPSFHNNVSGLLQSSPGWRTLQHVL